ncbi:SDR family NAD(P)-dependent oxidoreductase [Brevibacterium otitidis]|uniref:SDR family NAD(P)-dependent oxidoreductase n=1 Tax=Brevibacterium otitidis TaxID=53364 RepID=A0ABV5WXK0_9MICO
MTMEKQLEGKIVIVTGGAAGIGGATSRELIARGARVVAVDINAEAGAALASECGDDVVFLDGDVIDPEVAERAVSTAVETFGRLDGLVNNAHASTQKPFLQLEEADWELSFNTGFRATRQFMFAAHDALAETSGAVVNFASGSAISGQPTQAAYASAKEAIRGLTRVVANEWASEGIRVNLVSPLAMTEGVEKWKSAHPEMYEQVRAGVPLGRFGDPRSDIAPVVAFLLSDDADYMSGQTLMADGGTQKLY